jgi:hypothetical protein
MLRYKLRTLLILLAILPSLLWLGWGKYEAWRAEQERLRALNDGLTIQLMFVDVGTVEMPAPPPGKARVRPAE